MALSTYSELQSSIAGWLTRTNLTSRIPDFITLCESRVNKTLRVRQMEARATATFDEEYEELPSDFLEIRQLKLNTDPEHYLEYLTPAVLTAKYGNYGPSRPRAYAIIGEEIRLRPVPDGSYTAELAYYQKIPALSDSNTTNWLLTKAPDVYLYGSLLEAEPYIRNEQRATLWVAAYERAISDLTGESARAQYNGSPLVVVPAGGIA